MGLVQACRNKRVVVDPFHLRAGETAGMFQFIPSLIRPRFPPNPSLGDLHVAPTGSGRRRQPDGGGVEQREGIGQGRGIRDCRDQPLRTSCHLQGGSGELSLSVRVAVVDCYMPGYMFGGYVCLSLAWFSHAARVQYFCLLCFFSLFVVYSVRVLSFFAQDGDNGGYV